jgi:3-oxoacyl-[acyl-carrier-protein] synthase-3
MGPSDNPATGVKSILLHAEGSKAKALYTAAPGTALGKKTFIDKDDIDAGRVYFRMDGKAVFENGVNRMREGVEEIFKVNNIGFNDIDLVIPHQPNLRMIEELIARTKVPTDKIFVNVEKFGNMASACLPIALDQARKQGRVRSGNQIVLVAFGSGFVWATALLKM